MFGIAPAASGTVSVNGKPVSIREPTDAVALGLAFVPEDRAVAGIFRTLSVEQNITAAVPRRIAPRRLHPARPGEGAVDRRDPAAAHPPRLSSPADRRIVGRQPAEGDPGALAADRPERPDPRRADARHRHRRQGRVLRSCIGELAAGGRAILLISSEMPELIALCDRVLVMSEGRLTADLPRAEATQESIMRAAVPKARRAAA